MVAVTGREIATGLGDADNGLARLEFLRCEAKIQVALQVERCLVGLVQVVEPAFAA